MKYDVSQGCQIQQIETQDIQLNLKFDKQCKCISCSQEISPVLFFIEKRGNAPTINILLFFFVFLSRFLFHIARNHTVYSFPSFIKFGLNSYCGLGTVLRNMLGTYTINFAAIKYKIIIDCIFMLYCLVTESCCLFCNPVDCSPPGSSGHGISQARILEWVAISFSRESS